MGKKRIIYIIGAGRSGTTLLDILLGNQENIHSAGELNRFTFRRGIPTEFPPDSDRYVFWEKIKTSLETKYDLEELDRLQDKFEHHWGTVKRLFGVIDQTGYKHYQEFIKDYYTLIFNQINDPILIESSKYPGRALSLSETLSEYEISYIFLRRDPVGVVSSFAKKDVCHPSKDWIPANSYYFAINVLCHQMIDKLSVNHKYVSIRYEDLITKPSATFTNIESALNLDLTNVKSKIDANLELEVGNLFEGNRIRIPHTIRLMRETTPYPKTLKNRFTHLVNGWLY